jgi:hypothetical protein
MSSYDQSLEAKNICIACQRDLANGEVVRRHADIPDRHLCGACFDSMFEDLPGRLSITWRPWAFKKSEAHP